MLCIRPIKKHLLMILFPLAIFLFIELALRVFGYGNTEESEDFSRGLLGSHKIYRISEENGDLHERCPKQLDVADQTFSAKKRPNTFRIFCLGGSSTGGYPYFSPPGGFPKWIEIFLTSMYPFRNFEVINSGVSTYGSYRVSHVLSEIIEYDPDLILLYCGNNEFSEHWWTREWMGAIKLPMWFRRFFAEIRMYVLLRDLFLRLKILLPIDLISMPVLSGSEISIEKERRTVIEDYKRNILEMIRLAKEKGKKVWLLTVANNVKDWAPQKNLIDDPVYPDAEESLRKGDFDTALQLYRKHLEAQDEDMGIIHFAMAKCFEGKGEFEGAETQYLAARDADLYRLRAISAFNAALKDLSQRERVKLIDVEKALGSLSPNNVVGNNFFLDHCHPNMDGHIAIARVVCDEIAHSGIMREPHRDDKDLEIKISDYRKKAESDPRVRTDVFWLLGKTAYNNSQISMAVEQYEAAGRESPESLHVLVDLGLVYFELKKNEKALQVFEKVLSLNPEGAKRITDLEEIEHFKSIAREKVRKIKREQEQRQKRSEGGNDPLRNFSRQPCGAG